MKTVPVARSYAFENVVGISRGALDLHLSLYHGYVAQVGLLLRQSEATHRLAFELNGLLLHELFFEQLNGTPSDPESSPEGQLLHVMNSSFASAAAWRQQVTQLAQTRGIGWVLTAVDAEGAVLRNFWVAEHHLGVPMGFHPIAVFDLWEHAYLPDHASGSRGDYMTALFRNLDWTVLQSRLTAQAGLVRRVG